MKLLFIALLLSGCTTVTLETPQFHAKRTAWFTDVEGNFSMTTPDGAKLEAKSLKSTVDTEALNNLISAVAAGVTKP